MDLLQQQSGHYLVLRVHPDPLLHQVLDDGGVSLPGRPVHGIVTLHVQSTQVSSVTMQHPEHLQPSQPRGNVDSALPVLVGLVDIDVGNIEQLLQPGVIVLLYSTEDGGQNKVVILQQTKFQICTHRMYVCRYSASDPKVFWWQYSHLW